MCKIYRHINMTAQQNSLQAGSGGRLAIEETSFLYFLLHRVSD